MLRTKDPLVLRSPSGLWLTLPNSGNTGNTVTCSPSAHSPAALFRNVSCRPSGVPGRNLLKTPSLCYAYTHTITQTH